MSFMEVLFWHIQCLQWLENVLVTIIHISQGINAFICKKKMLVALHFKSTEHHHLLTHSGDWESSCLSFSSPSVLILTPPNNSKERLTTRNINSIFPRPGYLQHFLSFQISSNHCIQQFSFSILFVFHCLN